MAGVRHAFISRDGRSGAEWQRVGRQVDCARFTAFGPDQASPYDLIWVHAAGATAISGEHLVMVRLLAPAKRCIVLADVPDDRDALASFAAGAKGYCNSHSRLPVLKLVSDVVLQGGLWIGESLLRRLVVGVGEAVQQQPIEVAPQR